MLKCFKQEQHEDHSAWALWVYLHDMYLLYMCFIKLNSQIVLCFTVILRSLIILFWCVLFLYIIDVLMCCQAAVADLLTDLGSNVSINCVLMKMRFIGFYWKQQILQQWFYDHSQHQNHLFTQIKTCRNKYSVQFKHRLVINNVTADELGVYYCMNTRTPPKLSNSTRIYFNGEFICSFSDQVISVIIWYSLCYLSLEFLDTS